MTDPVEPPSSTARDGTPPPEGGAGRARSFRYEQATRRGTRRERVVSLAMVVVIVVGAYAILTEREWLGSTASSTPTRPGPPIYVTLGTPSVSSLTCAGGGTAYAERVPWTNSTSPLTTSEVYLRLYEIWDGDYIGDPGAVANATPAQVCEGSPPDATALWYAVLQAPNGTNLLTYTQGGSWASIGTEPTNVVIQASSVLVIVTGSSLAGTGRGFEVLGFVGTSQVSGSVPL